MQLLYQLFCDVAKACATSRSAARLGFALTAQGACRCVRGEGSRHFGLLDVVNE